MIRAALVSVHKYTGLLAGALLAVTGISGSILVFDHRLDEMLTPAVMTAAPSGDPAPLQDVVDAARAAAGDQPTRIYIARRPGSAHVVRFPAPPGAPGPVEVSVAPADAKVLAVRTWGEYPVSWVYHLHYGFLSGATGKLVVGVLGLCLLFFCVSGVVIWWPRRGRWRRALTIKRHAGAFRLNYDLHKTAGVYLLPVLAVVAFSGVELVFPGPVERSVARVLPVDDYPAPQSSVPPGGADEALTVDRAVAAGQAVCRTASSSACTCRPASAALTNSSSISRASPGRHTRRAPSGSIDTAARCSTSGTQRRSLPAALCSTGSFRCTTATRSASPAAGSSSSAA